MINMKHTVVFLLLAYFGALPTPDRICDNTEGPNQSQPELCIGGQCTKGRHEWQNPGPVTHAGVKMITKNRGRCECSQEPAIDLPNCTVQHTTKAQQQWGWKRQPLPVGVPSLR
ncbi:uncharacterized protein ASPGLDRAFT_52776 [Aspergillus glaucus CBS 516.65]|uniref:Cyanovirin-N domain-containing protein n=1 Tax=Aspergillus glaucus CBS 516.65 TaxID=1160497 RepID=A0A1L9V5X4_ASPGL|nr:hypothetical protein ASPGLDRAFT_52776 [Aspergillus glaucus CBS 516.65]OJJ79323.1 hypothetical protein ASPGLDRAFT_52776 [Aspergillus glaucus CBS 516.65]